MDIGMTPERQAEMQRSLMTMLGDRRQMEQQASSVKDSKPSKSRSIKLSSDTPPPVPPAAMVQPPLPPSISEEVAASVNNANNSEPTDQPDDDLGSWVCDVCTLLNSPSVACCGACETPRT